MLRVRRAALLATLAIFGFATPHASAITFDLNFVSGATNTNDPGDVFLQSIVTAAADRWADLIEDNYTMTLNVSYYTNDSMGNGPCGMNTQTACAPIVSANGAGSRTSEGNILFFANRNWYYDPTPYGDSEFNFTQTLHDDLSFSAQSAGFGGASPETLLEVGYRGANNFSDPNVSAGFDMLSTAFHEIGHHLGVTNQFSGASNETMDGDYDIPPSLLNGAQMSVIAAAPNFFHTVDAFPLMSTVGAGRGVRRIPSAADIFAMASVSNWTQINLERIDYLSTTSTSWTTNGNWEGNRVPDAGDFVGVRHGGTARISGGANVNVGEVLIDNDSRVSVTSGSLTTDILRIESSGSLSLSGGEVRVRRERFDDNGGGFSIAGQASPTFRLTNGAIGTTESISLGSFLQISPGNFIPAPGNLEIESGASMSVDESIVIGGAGPNPGHGEVTVDDAELAVFGAIVLSPTPTSALSRLRVQNDGSVIATTIQSLVPTNRISVSSGLLKTENLLLPAAGILQHSGGEVQVTSGSYNMVDERIAGLGAPVVRLTEGATATSGNLSLGGFQQINPSTFLPTTGELQIEDGATLTTNGNVVLGGTGFSIVGPGIAEIDAATWDVSGSILLAPVPTSGLSRLTVSGSANVTATTIQAIIPTSRISIQGGNVTTENFIVPAPGILTHTGGTLTVDGGTYTNPTTRIAGFGSPLLLLTAGASGATGNIQLGGIFENFPGNFLPQSGALRIEAGSTLTSGDVQLGTTGINSGPGSATIDNGTWNVSGDIDFASTPTLGISELTIQNGGVLTANAIQSVQPTGRITLDGGSLTAESLFAPAANFTFLDGELQVQTFVGPLIQDGGSIVIGTSPGEMQLSGSYVQNGGVLEIELAEADLAGAEYDLLSITGGASLAGGLDVSLLDGFTPELGDRFVFLSATGGVTGNFTAATLPTISSDLDWNLDYQSDRVVLEVLSAFTADFDDDGDVDADDLHGATDGWHARFADDLDGGNFLDWQRQLGSGIPALRAGSSSTAAFDAVPEPTTLALIAAALLLHTGRSSAKRQHHA